MNQPVPSVSKLLPGHRRYRNMANEVLAELIDHHLAVIVYELHAPVSPRTSVASRKATNPGSVIRLPGAR